VIIQKTFRYRLEPNAGQRRLFARFAGCCRFIFNRGLAARMEAYERGGKTLSLVLQQSLKDLDSAYRHFFLRVKKGEKPGFPRFKKKGLKDSFRYPQGIKVQDGKVFLPKIGWAGLAVLNAGGGASAMAASVKQESLGFGRGECQFRSL
jgi:putative transposase